jgi:hypothetical protein
MEELGDQRKVVFSMDSLEILWGGGRGDGALAPTPSPAHIHKRTSTPMKVVYITHYAKTTLQWSPCSFMCVKLGVQGHSVSTVHHTLMVSLHKPAAL